MHQLQEIPEKISFQATDQKGDSMTKIPGQLHVIQSKQEKGKCFRWAGDHFVPQCTMDPDSLHCTECKRMGHVAKVSQAGRFRQFEKRKKHWNNFKERRED